MWRFIKPVEGFVEIRLTPTKLPTEFNKKFFYLNLNNLTKQLPTTPNNKKVCFFTKHLEEVKTILTFNDGWFGKNTKICYGVNERYINNNKIDGSYESLKYYRFIVFDVDKTLHTNLENGESERLDNFINVLIKYLERYNLHHPTIIDSGAGRHILYKIKRVKITEGRREWYKEWGKEINKKFSNDIYCVDNIYDATRVLGLVGSLNVKRGRLIKIINLNFYENEFKFKSKKIKMIKEIKIEGSRDERIKKVLNERFVQLLLTKQLPEGGRNNILIFSLKCLLKNMGFTQNDVFVKQLFKKINTTQKEVFASNFPKNNVEYRREVVENWLEKQKYKY